MQYGHEKTAAHYSKIPLRLLVVVPETENYDCGPGDLRIAMRMSSSQLDWDAPAAIGRNLTESELKER